MKNILGIYIYLKKNKEVFFNFHLELDIPDQISTETIVSYNIPMSCDIVSRASQSLKMKVHSLAKCAQNKTCHVDVAAKGKYMYKLR